MASESDGDKRHPEILTQLEKVKRYAAIPYSQLQTELFPLFLKQVRHAYSATKYWNRILDPKAKAIASARTVEGLLSNFAPLTRSEVQKNILQMRCLPPGGHKSLLIETKTSGSTGQPVRVLQYRPDTHDMRQALRLLDAIWHERDFSRPLTYFRSSKEDGRGSRPAEPFTLLGNTQISIHFKPKGRSYAEMLDFLEEQQVTTVLMNMVQARGISREQLVNPRENIRLKEILGWTEAVTDSDRELVREAFGAKISNRYSAEEFGYLAMQCHKHNHLHALQFLNYIEILDDAGKPCPVGVTGNVAVTNFLNRAQPMFRYLLGDAAAWGEPCDAGVNLPVLLPQLTRQRDIIKLPDGGDWLPALARTALVKQPIVFDFQIVLFLDRVVVLYSPTPNWTEEARAAVVESVAAEFPLNIPVLLIESPSLLWLGNWKRRTFIVVKENTPADITEEGVRDLVMASGYKPDAGVGVIETEDDSDL